MRPFIRNGYNYDLVEASVSTGLFCTDESRADQGAKEECDINTIVRRFGVTGQLPIGVRMPEYADFVDAADYQTSLNAIAKARESFDSMPAAVRDRFQNDPNRFVDFCADERNRPEALRMGLIPAQALELLAGAPAAGLSTGTPTAALPAEGGVTVGKP